MNGLIWNYRRRRAAVSVLAAGLLLLCACAGPPGERPSASPPPASEEPLTADPILFTVDGFPVSEAEYTLFFQKQRAATAQYFSDTYGAQTGPDFWTGEYDGQTPLAYCKALALEEVVRFKTELILARERGLIDRVDFADLMEDRETLNRENAQRMENGEPVYGLPSLDPWPYLLRLRSDCATKLLESEQERNGGTVSDDVLLARYEADIERYQMGAEVTYERLSLDGAAADEPEALLAQVAEAARKGGTLAEAAQALALPAGYTVGTETNTEVAVGKDDFWEQTVQEQVLTLRPGEVSAPFFAGGTGYLIRCIERTDLGCQSFEEVRSNVLYLYSADTLEETLRERAEAAVVEFPDHSYEAYAPQ